MKYSKKMKNCIIGLTKLVICCVCLNVSMGVFAQVTSPYKAQFEALDTNGPMGECLFPVSDDGNVIYQKVVESNYSKLELKEMAIKFFKILDKEDIYDVRTIQVENESYYDFDVNIASGRFRQETGFASWMRDISTVRSHVKIEFKEGRYRYTVVLYETNRQTIRGEAKSDGKPNIIHWQRVNSLTKERDNYRKGSKKYNEFDAQIKLENEWYHMEFNAVQRFLERLDNYPVEVQKNEAEADF